MRHLILALVILITPMPDAVAGAYKPVPVPGGGYHPGPAIPPPQIPRLEPLTPPITVPPKPLEPLQPGQIDHPVLVVPPGDEKGEPSPDGELVECRCLCGDGTCADQQNNQCTGDGLDANGEKVRYTCQ